MNIQNKIKQAPYMGGIAERRSSAGCYAWLALCAELNLKELQ